MNPIDPLEELNKELKRAYENGMLFAASFIAFGFILAFVYVKCFETPEAPKKVAAQTASVCYVEMSWERTQTHAYTGNIKRASLKQRP